MRLMLQRMNTQTENWIVLFWTNELYIWLLLYDKCLTMQFVLQNKFVAERRQLQEWKLLHQGIIDCIGTDTFAKEPKLAKLLQELKPKPVSYNKESPLVFVACL